MKTAGVIAEFNPFHRGHQYFLEEIRRQSGADYIIAVMSGDFVQRGTPAIFNKYIRTEMALAGGADLVCELPLISACSSAERFTNGGTTLLESMGCVQELWFGSECGNIELLRRCALLFSEEPEAYRSMLKEEMKSGKSYPAARASAAASFLQDDAISSVLSMPNNILGIEYIRSLLTISSGIRPRTLKRKGSGYSDSEIKEQSFSSAAAIRNLILTEPQETAQESLSCLRKQLPERSCQILVSSRKSNPPVTEDDFSEMLLYQLYKEDPDSLSAYLDLGPDLAKRIFNLRSRFTSFSQFADQVKTKNITRTSVNRALLHILTGIKSEDSAAISHPACIRVLGFRKDSSPLLTELAKSAKLPLVTHASDLKQVLRPDQLRSAELAYNLYEAVRAKKAGQACLAEASRPIIVI